MPTVGDFKDPFPFSPYPVQDDAVTRLRRFLQLPQQHTTAVLESPTGTGKSHMLLASVLSDLFTPVRPTASVAPVEGAGPSERPSTCAPCSNSNAGETEETASPSLAHAAPAATGQGAAPGPSLEDILRQRLYEEEVARMTDERKQRVSLLRRRLREARKRKALFLHAATRSSTGAAVDSRPSLTLKRDRGGDCARETAVGDGGGDPPHGEDDEYLVEQHPLDFLGERCSGEESFAFSFTSSSSSSSSPARADDCDATGDSGSDEADEDADAEASLLSRLAALVPLRKPKAYLASRTHTQIAQLFDDLLHTDFVRYPIRHNRHGSVLDGAKESGRLQRGEASAEAEAPRPLRAVHVGGRQQLCVNAAIRQAAAGRGEVLNDLCREAMRFENSTAGRAARRAANKRKASGVSLSLPALSSNGPGGTASCLVDIEDVGVAGTGGGRERGCALCATSRLKALLTHLRAAAKPTGADAATHMQEPLPHAAPLSLEAMRSLGESMQACPYLASRLLVRGADVVLLPYGYLADESLRDNLLGGVATNPMNEKEEMEEAARGNNAPGVTGSSSPTSLLLQRKRRALAASASVWKPHPQRDHRGKGIGNVNDESVNGIEASAKGPNLRGDIVVLDEAHNVVDYCRSICTRDMTHDELTLVGQLFAAYLACYEARLLTKNKQRLREMGQLIDKVTAYLRRTLEAQSNSSTLAARAHSASLPAAQNGEASGVVKDFASFLFEAGIDHVDVFPFLTFLVDSRISQKLLGLVPFMLQQEARRMTAWVQETQQRQRLTRLDQARRAHKAVSGGSTRGVPPEKAEGGAALAPPSAQPFHTIFEKMLLPRHCSSTGNNSNTSAAAPVPPVHEPFSMEEAVGATACAMQKFEALLRAFCISDTGGHSSSSNNGGGGSTTRVLLEMRHTLPIPFASPSPSPSPGMVASMRMKVVQLEPGPHTLGPVMQEARHVILAGGTMQPLALSCGLLMPPSVQEWNEKVMAPRAGPPPVSLGYGAGAPRLAKCDDGVMLISEPHVVAPSSIRVWALPCGPSGRRLEFSHHALTAAGAGAGAGGDRTSSTSFLHPSSPSPTPRCTSTGTTEEAAFQELAMALLNFVRVLPPAGVICFFTSYDMERRFHDFLVRRGLLDDINAVKKIFREAAVAAAGASSGYDGAEKRANRGGGGGVDDMLRAYKAWIEGDEEPTRQRRETLGGGDEDGTHATQRQQQQQPQRRRRGALLFAVMGGKLSEGINFGDDLGRAVLVVGLPYANLSDVELRLFLRHVAATRLAPQRASGSLPWTPTAPSPSPSARGVAEMGTALPTMSREEWSLYTDMSLRTVNQCIGRCIRHIRDYATVILLDARYAERADVRGRISVWMQPSLKVAQSFGECFRDIRVFFEEKQQQQQQQQQQ